MQSLRVISSWGKKKEQKAETGKLSWPSKISQPLWHFFEFSFLEIILSEAARTGKHNNQVVKEMLGFLLTYFQTREISFPGADIRWCSQLVCILRKHWGAGGGEHSKCLLSMLLLWLHRYCLTAKVFLFTNDCKSNMSVLLAKAAIHLFEEWDWSSFPLHQLYNHIVLLISIKTMQGLHFNTKTISAVWMNSVKIVSHLQSFVTIKS